MRIMPMVYCFGAELAAPGDQTMEPAWVAGNPGQFFRHHGYLERVLQRLRKYFGDMGVSPLMAGPCQVSMAAA